MSGIRQFSLLFFCASFNSVVNAQQLVVEHIANAGVKISSGDRTVLIDALFGPHQRFNSLNEKAFSELIEQGAQVVMTSHYHSDHFAGKRARQYLRANEETMFIAPPQVLDYLSDLGNLPFLKGPQLTDFQSTKFSHKGVDITVLNFPHMSPEQTADVQNYAYIVKINGWKILHIGDGGINPTIIDGLNLADRNIDLALLHDLCPEQEDCVERIKQIGAKQVAFYHMTDDRTEPVGSWITENYPAARMLVTGQQPVLMSKE